MARLDARLELRLDKQTFERLELRAAADHISVAQLVREAITHELQGGDECWRTQALERGLSLDVPVPDDPADLVRDLDAGYEAEGSVLPASAVRD
jgi:plasmid stability protein